MWGVGDNIHQLAVLREAMRSHDVYLQTANTSIYESLVKDGLKIIAYSERLAPRIRESRRLETVLRAPRGAPTRRLTYDKATIYRRGSILAAMFAAAGIKMPERPDFSLPIAPEWRANARRLIATWRTGGKPIMIYRPIVLNKVWECPARAPDPQAYAELFQSIRKGFFVISVADLKPGKEWIIPPEQSVDVKLHAGELDFETLAALVAEADLVFANPGFMPVLAQSVGTRNVIVYGGNESFRTTNSVGAHLAPTLAIEADKPCECHARTHKCDKRITLPPAIKRLREFVQDMIPRARTLIFGTVFVDTIDKLNLAKRWIDFHTSINPDCDFLLVDSKSPLGPLVREHMKGKGEYYSFPDNIGHLARGGRDGWGRAFCHGLNTGIVGGYSYVVHVEGDSLFRLPIKGMEWTGIKAASIPVFGTIRPEREWVETGLMIFSTAYLRDSNFIARYDWETPKHYPRTPEAVVRELLGDDLCMMTWAGERGDRGQITAANVKALDWVTHVPPAVFDVFVSPTGDRPSLKINFGCGTNKLDGWKNHDAEVDITKPLPYPDASADFVMAEHVVEHIGYYEAIEFFKECRRILKPGGVVRICVPSIERVHKCADQDYFNFTKKWGPSADARGAMHAMLYAHGHKTGWTASLLESTLFYAGFGDVTHYKPGDSLRPALQGVEGHGRVIGDRFNEIESIVCEGVKS